MAPWRGCIGLHQNLSSCIGYTWSYATFITLPQIDEMQCYIQTYPQLHSNIPNWRTSLQTRQVKIRKHLLRRNQSWNTRQDFLKTPSLWEAVLRTEQRCSSKSSLNQMSLPINQDHKTPSAQFRHWRFVVRNLELVSLAFNFNTQRSHHSLTLPGSRFMDSATVIQRPRDGTTAIRKGSSA